MRAMKKRVLSMLLAASMLLSMVITTSAADPTLRLAVGEAVNGEGSTQILPGDTITVPLTITENPGTACLNVEVRYDAEVLTCTGITEGADGVYSTYTVNPDEEGTGIAYIVASNNKDSDKTGEYAVLAFTVAADTKADSTQIKLSILDGDEDNCSNASYEAVPAAFTDGSVKIEQPTPTTVEVSGETALEVPATADYTALVKDQFGNDMAGVDVIWSVTKADGVSIKDGKLTVDKTAQSGTVTVTAKAGEVEGTLEVAITRPAAQIKTVTISGENTVAVPDAKTGEAQLTLTAEAIDQFDVAVADAQVTWTVSEAQGVSISDKGVLTVTNKAAAGKVTVTAACAGVSDTKEITVTKAASKAASLTFVAGETATMSIPTGDEPNTRTFDVVAVDQYGDEMQDAKVSYTLKGDDFVSAKDNTVTVKKGAKAGDEYVLTAASGSVKAQLTITVVDIDVTWPTVKVADKPTYGSSWAQLITLTGGSASLDGNPVSGKFSLVEGKPAAGEQTYTIQFVSDDGQYNVTTTGTVTIAPKALTATWSGYQNLTYTGEAVSVNASVSGVVEGDAVNVTVADGNKTNAGEYTATAAIDNDNYTLTNSEQAYTIAKATATLEIADQTIKAGKTNADLLKLIGAVEAKGVKEENLEGTLTVVDDISGVKAGTSKAVNVSFAHENGNYVTPVTAQVQVEFVEGDPQTVKFAQDSLSVTYGDTGVKNAATVEVGNKTDKIVYASDNEKVATVAEDGSLTLKSAGTAKITATAPKNGDYVETSVSYTLAVAPKAVTITGVTVEDKTYDGKTDAKITAFGTVDGIVGEDDVTVDSAKAAAAFAAANVGEQVKVTFTGFALKGAAAANYTLSAQPAETEAKITKADPTITLGNLSQRVNSVTAVTATLTPASETATVTVEYQVVDQPAVAAVEGKPCGHVESKEGCTAEEGQECDHTDNCGYVEAVEAKEATYKWVTEVPTEIGAYPVRAYTEGDANLNPIAVDKAVTGNLVISRRSSGGGSSSSGGGTTTVTPKPEEKPKAEEIVAKFTDVKEDDWFYSAVVYAVENNLFSGTSETSFSPNVKLNRGMLVTVLAGLEFGEKGAPEAQSSFTDLTADWYKNSVAWAVKSGLTSGVAEGEFGPEQNVTREQVAMFLYGYAKMKGYDTTVKTDLNAYADAGQVSGYAQQAMAWAVSKGLISGVTADSLAPQGEATRAQVAVIFMQFSQLAK